MAESDSHETQRNPPATLASELEAAGYVDAEEIGHGGFGIVFRCRQPALDRVVAVKVLTDELDQENLDRFLREQRAMGRVSGHPHIVHLLHVDVTDSGTPFLVMPYHARGSLDSRIRRRGPLSWEEALGVGVKLAGALETAHRVGVLHRDVKPANILLSDYGDPQLTDFGISRIAGGFETATGAVTGTPAFTAPEVLQGLAPSPASDVYGLGATLFAAITGHAAFERRRGEKVVAQFLRITTEPVPDLSATGIPGAVASAITRAMAADPHDRPATAAEFGEALRGAEAASGLNIDEMALPGGGADEAAPQGSRRASKTVPPVRGRGVRVAMPPVPGTKFRPTTPIRPWVPRNRLLDALRGGRDRRLTVIHAPAGYGKSTLAAQWAHVLAEEGHAVGWLTVDHDDNNVVWFLAHLIEALRRVRPALARELGDVLEEHGDQADRYVLASLIDDIHDSDEHVVLVIDDWHRVTDKATVGAMEFLLDNCCHHLQVVVTSRSHAGLPMSRLRVRGELNEIDSRTLRFDATESQSFLVDIGGLALEPRDVADLTESVDGWVAALQLASLSLRGFEDPTQLIGRMSGRHHAIAEFLAENVLDTLEPELLEFLLATSVTERVCGSLAASLTGTRNGHVVLEEIERRDLFLIRADEDGEWFRYHHLFRDFLLQRLERDHPERIRELHRAASEWFAEHGHLSQAVDHAVAAGDDRNAVDLVESHGLTLVEHSHMASLLALVAKLPSALVSASPRLLLTVAWANINLVQPVPARAALDSAGSALARTGDTESGETSRLRIEVAVARGAVDVSTDHVAGVDRLVSECLEKPTTLAPFVVSAAADVATFLGIYGFDFSAARRWQQWAQPYHRRAGGPLTVTYGHCLDGIAAYEMLDIAAAEECFRTALAVARRSGGSRSYAVRLACAHLGRLLYELGDLNQAEALIDESCEINSDCAVVDFMIAKYVIGARLVALRGDVESSARRLEQGHRTADTFSLERLRAAVANERVRLGIAMPAGVKSRPSTTSADADTPLAARRHPGTGIERIVAEIDDSSVILRLLGDRSPSSAHSACRRAHDLVTRLETEDRPRALLEARLLLIAGLSSARRMDEAKQMLAPVVATCSRLGLLRMLIDQAAPVVDVVAALQRDQLDGRSQSRWATVPGAFLAETMRLAGESPLVTIHRGGF